MTKVKRKNIRTRIAPSPTGYLHIGTARTALFNWLFAKHHAGTFILRIEDTDLERSDPLFEKDIVEGLEWLGLSWDEFYRQSERTKIYNKYIAKLLGDGRAFWCYHSKEELEREQKEQINRKEAPRHVCEHKSQNLGIKTNNEGGIIRLAVDENSDRKIKFSDIIRGEIEFEERLFGDISIAKDEHTPLYNFAVAVDDFTTEVSHVIRGEDHITNTPKQILIQEALGLTRPVYVHLPLILDKDRSKLSKRQGAASLKEYKEAGYLPEAMINFLSFLGWTPKDTKREILTANEIIERFLLEDIHRSGAVFNKDKLDWINSQYIKTLSDQQLIEAVAPFIGRNFGEQARELIERAAPLFRERLERLEQVGEFEFLFREPEYEPELLTWKNNSREETNKSLNEAAEIIRDTGVENKNKLREKLDELGTRLEDRGTAYWPFRVALSGQKKSPDPVDIAFVLGKEKTLERILKAIEKIRKA